MKITYNTVKNTKQLDKPNEDIIFCDLEKNIYILLNFPTNKTDANA